MSVKLRLARAGRKKLPFYHVIATDSRNTRDGKFIENLGSYNPLMEKGSKNYFTLDVERAEYWLSVGAQPSERVALLMINHGIKSAEKFRPVFVPKEKQEKTEKKK